MLMGVVGWVVLGVILGFIATKLVDLHGDDPNMGICIGAAAGLVGGWMYSLFSGAAVTAFNEKSLLSAAVVAAVVLFAWHGWRAKSAA